VKYNFSKIFARAYQVIDTDPFWVPSTEEELELYGDKSDSINRAQIHEERPQPEWTARYGESGRIRRKAARGKYTNIKFCLIFRQMKRFNGNLFQNYPNSL
jgi:hypothetical protein